MRIIGGKLRGRTITAPPGRSTRPMLDRVREAMFSTLTPWLEGARVLDLFSGTGSLGLEALSRGAERARLVEQGAQVVSILQRNVEKLGLEEEARVVIDDAFEPRSWGTRRAFDIVFLDPPYPILLDRDSRTRVLDIARRLVLEELAPEGVAVLHVPKRGLWREEFPPELSTASREYGTNTLWYLQPAELPGSPEPEPEPENTDEGEDDARES
jgi:16S rRNA (guanine966-N2)-methyltransferase